MREKRSRNIFISRRNGWTYLHSLRPTGFSCNQIKKRRERDTNFYLLTFICQLDLRTFSLPFAKFQLVLSLECFLFTSKIPDSLWIYIQLFKVPVLASDSLLWAFCKVRVFSQKKKKKKTTHTYFNSYINNVTLTPARATGVAVETANPSSPEFDSSKILG